MDGLKKWAYEAARSLERMMKSRPVRWLALLLGVVVVVALWLSTLWFVPYFERLLPRFTELRSAVDVGRGQYGAIGDMFGAVNALFSGLALGAIALTLWLEARSRRESRKPLVLGGVESGNVVISRPKNVAGSVALNLKVPMTLSNQTTDAALNVSGKLRMLVSPKTEWQVGLDGPLLRDADQDVVFNIDLAPRDWEPLLEALTSQREVEMELTTTYRSLEGVNWKTIVVYCFYVRTAAQHYELLDTVRNGTWADEGVWQEDALVSVSARIKQGSWDHRLN